MRLVENWKRLWKSYTVLLASAGIFLPDVLQVIADNVDGLPMIDAQFKSLARLCCLVAIVLLRPVKQESLR